MKLATGPASDDRGPISQRLTSQGQRTIDRRSRVDAFADADAGGVGVAMKLDISAKRQCANPPTCAAGVDARGELGAEAERKRINFNAAPSADQIVAEFVHRDDQRSG